jgi:hypothetical protein
LVIPILLSHRLGGTQPLIGTSLIGWLVGGKPAAERWYEVWFGRLLLGWIDSAP